MFMAVQDIRELVVEIQTKVEELHFDDECLGLSVLLMSDAGPRREP